MTGLPEKCSRIYRHTTRLKLASLPYKNISQELLEGLQWSGYVWILGHKNWKKKQNQLLDIWLQNL